MYIYYSGNKYTIYVHSRKIYNLFVQTLETDRKAVILQYKKSPKPLPNCLKIAETSVLLIVFNGVICDVSAYYTVTVSVCRSTRIRYQKCFLSYRSM